MEVRFYKTPSGRVPAREFIMNLSDADMSCVIDCLHYVEADGVDAVGVDFRRIEGKLYELKIRGRDGAYRLFYVTLKGKIMVILQGYKKKSQKAPIKELDLARKRIKEVFRDETSYYTS